MFVGTVRSVGLAILWKTLIRVWAMRSSERRIRSLGVAAVRSPWRDGSARVLSTWRGGAREPSTSINQAHRGVWNLVANERS